MSLHTGGCWEVGGLSWRRETGSRGPVWRDSPKMGHAATRKQTRLTQRPLGEGSQEGLRTERSTRVHEAELGGQVREQGLGGRRGAKPQRVLDDVRTVPCSCLHRRVHTWDNRRGASDPSLTVTHTPRTNPQICKDHAPSGVRPCFCGMCQTRQSHREAQWIHGCQELGGGAGEGPRIRTELLLE